MSDAADAQRRLWTIGHYPTMARHLLPISVTTIEALWLQAGDRVLDVAVGDGNAAIEAARRGAVVTGVDLTPSQIERARERCAAEGVDIELAVGDAQQLEFADGTFDAATSVMGMIFAPDHERATAELARVCRPGGRIALTSWTNGGWTVHWRERLAHVFPPAPPGSIPTEAWGDPDEMARRLDAAAADASVREEPFSFRFPSAAEAAQTFLETSGPFIQVLEHAAALGHGDEARSALGSVIEEANVATDGSCELPMPFLLGVATVRS